MASTQKNELGHGESEELSKVDTTLMARTSAESATSTQELRGTQNRSLCYRYSYLLAHYPVTVFISILVATVACGVVATVAYSLPDFSDPIKGFEARGTEISRRILSHRNLNFPDSKAFRPLQRPENRAAVLSNIASKTFEQSTVEAPTYSNATTNDTVSATSSETQAKLVVLGQEPDEPDKLEFCSPTFYPLSKLARMVLVPKKIQSLFSMEAMWSMCSIENEIVRTHPSFTRACCGRSLQYSANNESSEEECKLSWSLGNVVAMLNNKRSCEDIMEKDVENTKKLLQQCAPFYERGVLNENCDSPGCAGLPLQCVKNGLVYKIFHYLTPSSFVQEAKQGTFKLTSTMVFLPIEMLYHLDELWDIFTDLFEQNVVTNGNSKVGALEFGIKYDLFASYLQSDTLYLGLGAFVVIVIIMLYVGSPFITAMTLINMIMSLVLAFFAYKAIFQLPFFPFVNIAAAVLVIGIGADDTFVFVDIWTKAREDISKGQSTYDRVAVVHETLRHASVTMFVTSFTTGSALYASAVSSITAVKCFAIFAGTAIVANFIFTVTWLPVVIIINDILNEMCSALLRRKVDTESQSVQNKPCGSIDSLCLKLSRFLTEMFTVHLKTAVFKLRIVWILLLFGLAVGGFCIVFVTPKLQLPSQSDFQVFKSSHPFEKYSIDYKNNYNFEEDQVNLLPYIVIWGLQALDNGNHWDPDSTGKIKFDKQFDLSDPRSQEWLYNFCNQMQNQSFISKTVESYCFVEYIRTVLQSPCTVGLMSEPCCGRDDFPFPRDIFQNCTAVLCRDSTNCNIYHGMFKFGPWFDGDQLVALSVVTTSTYKLSLDYNLMDDFWKTANTWTEDQIQQAPPGLSRGWFISHSLMQLHFYDLQGSLATGAPAAVGISLAIAAAVLLLTTRNILISLYAMLSISGAVFVTIGSLVLLGWQLNIFESAILSLAVGLSVDFTIHYGVAYELAPFKDKRGRTEFSIDSLAPAITVAALSTFAAGAMMLPATVLTYVQLGTFLMLVMTISWSYATFFFLALCRTIGPRGNIAQIPIPKCIKCDKQDSAKSQERIENGSVVSDQNEPLKTETLCNGGQQPTIDPDTTSV